MDKTTVQVYKCIQELKLIYLVAKVMGLAPFSIQIERDTNEDVQVKLIYMPLTIISWNLMRIRNRFLVEFLAHFFRFSWKHQGIFLPMHSHYIAHDYNVNCYNMKCLILIKVICSLSILHTI